MLQISFTKIFADNRNNSTGGSPRLTSPPLMSPPPIEPQAHDKTPVKINGVVSKPKRDSVNGEGNQMKKLMISFLSLYLSSALEI